MAKNKTQIIAEPNSHAITIIREFDAPRDLVWQAFTDEKLYIQWVGPRDLKMRIEKFEPWTGGSYRYIHVDPQGNEYAFNGVTHLVQKPNLIIDTFEFEGLPERGHVALQKAQLEELPGGRTRFTGTSVFQSVADRDGMIASGMEHGVVEGHERLDEVLATLNK